MDLDLKELGITLLVGAFTIIAIEVIAYFFFNKRPIGYIAAKLSFEAQRPVASHDDATPASGGGKTTKNEKEHTLTLAAFFLFAFAFGIVFENLSSIADERDQIPFRTMPAIVLGNTLATGLALPTKTDDRVFTLIGDFEKPSPLCRDLAKNKAFEIHGSDDDRQVQTWINNNMKGSREENPGSEKIEKSIKNLYYFAKNTGYSHPQHYDELSKIQERYEVLMSLSMLAFIFFVVATVVGTPLYVKRYLDYKKTKGDKRLRKMRGKIPLIVISFLLIYLVCLSAFARESDEFNRRAFGYLSTTLISEARPKPTPTPSPTPTPTPTPRLSAL